MLIFSLFFILTQVHSYTIYKCLNSCSRFKEHKLKYSTPTPQFINDKLTNIFINAAEELINISFSDICNEYFLQQECTNPNPELLEMTELSLISVKYCCLGLLFNFSF